MILKCPHCRRENKIAGMVDPYMDGKQRISTMTCAYCEKNYTTDMCRTAEEREHPAMTTESIVLMRENARRHNQFAAVPVVQIDAGQLQLLCDEALKYREIVQRTKKEPVHA